MFFSLIQNYFVGKKFILFCWWKNCFIWLKWYILYNSFKCLCSTFFIYSLVLHISKSHKMYSIKFSLIYSIVKCFHRKRRRHSKVISLLDYVYKKRLNFTSDVNFHRAWKVIFRIVFKSWKASLFNFFLFFFSSDNKSEKSLNEDSRKILDTKITLEIESRTLSKVYFLLFFFIFLQ